MDLDLALEEVPSQASANSDSFEYIFKKTLYNTCSWL